MAKKSIGKILAKGSHRQRAALLFVNMLNSGIPDIGKPSLSKEEERLLDQSFSAPGAAKVYNDYLQAYDKIIALFGMLIGGSNAYGRDTLFETLLLEQFINSHNYRALFISLSSLKIKEVNKETEAFSSSFGKVDIESFQFKRERNRLDLVESRAKRKQSLAELRAYEKGIKAILTEYNLEGATLFLQYVQKAIKEGANYEGGLNLILFDITDILIGERRAFLRAYAEKEPKLLSLIPLKYESVNPNENIYNYLTKFLSDEKER
jgi:hypothetical protein